MSNLTYYDYAGFGDYARENIGYRQAVRVGDRIECSGQGGWIVENDSFRFPSDLEEQIDQAFKNVTTALQAAGGKGWEQVFRLNSYHTDIDEEVTKIMGRCFKKHLGEHKVIWTQIGVKVLGAPGMEVELEVSAYVGQ